jgi:hypothetical protein
MKKKLRNKPSLTAEDWLKTAHHEFDKESDRAAAIVVAAILDDALETLIESLLVPALSPKHSIINGHRSPLGTFGARIDAAFQLGLISNYMARDLHLVLDIRNDFAHNPFGCTFDSMSIRNRIRELESSSDFNHRHPNTRRAIGPPGPRWDFLAVTTWMLYSLRSEKVKQLSEPSPEFGYIDWSSLSPEIKEKLQRLKLTPIMD